MLSIRIWNYGDYSSNNYGSSRAVQVGPITLFYSYETVIAYRDPKEGLVCCTNEWGPTTGKHLNWINSDKRHRIPIEFFNARLAALLKRYDIIDVSPKELSEKYNKMARK